MNSLGDWILAITFFFFWLMALWIFVVLPGRVPARRPGRRAEGRVDLFMLVLPFLGCLVYIITRPKVTATDVRGLAMAQAASKVSTADELQKLADLKAAGVVNDQEYENLKAKIVVGLIQPLESKPVPSGGAGFFVFGIRTRGRSRRVRRPRVGGRLDRLEARVRLEQAQRDRALDRLAREDAQTLP